MKRRSQVFPIKGQCHEMKNWFEGLKNQISTFCIGADDFKNFCIFNVMKSTGTVLFKFLHAFMKTLTNSGYFTGSCIRIPPPPNETGGNSKGIVSPNSAFNMPTVNHPPVMKSNTVTPFKIISGLRNSLQTGSCTPQQAV
jgi:hypothetical protein